MRQPHKESIIENKQQKICELEADSEKLGYLKRLLCETEYDKVIELSEEERDKQLTRGRGR